MSGSPDQANPADGQTAFQLIRRLITEYGLTHWPRYAVAFVLMGIGAGCTALCAYLMGTVVNEAYVNRSFPGIVTLGFLTMAIFAIKGAPGMGRSALARAKTRTRPLFICGVDPLKTAPCRYA
jgi:ABC-type multidrug transport system fused ATPase/permease subunit